jgi:uncharacterized membrane protein YraQ (UPF0718 family)
MEPKSAKDKSQVKKGKGSWIFLGIVILIFLGVMFFYPDKIKDILKVYSKVLMQIIPIFILVYLIMLGTNYFISNKFIQKHMAKDVGVKTWLIAIVSGILSIGPIYMWYPLMQNLKEKGVKDKYIATFLYNRGIKLQWLPMLLLYFGLKYSIIVLIVMALVSVPQGIITEKIIKRNS